MADRHQLRSGFGCRSLDGAAAEVSLEFVVVVLDGVVVVDGVDGAMLDALLVSLGAVVVDGLVAGVEVVAVLESAGRVEVSLVDCA